MAAVETGPLAAAAVSVADPALSALQLEVLLALQGELAELHALVIVLLVVLRGRSGRQRCDHLRSSRRLGLGGARLASLLLLDRSSRLGVRAAGAGCSASSLGGGLLVVAHGDVLKLSRHLASGLARLGDSHSHLADDLELGTLLVVDARGARGAAHLLAVGVDRHLARLDRVGGGPLLPDIVQGKLLEGGLNGVHIGVPLDQVGRGLTLGQGANALLLLELLALGGLGARGLGEDRLECLVLLLRQGDGASGRHLGEWVGRWVGG